MAMSRRAAEAESRGERVLHLEVGQPSTGGSMALCGQWLEQLGVAATPGLDFDLTRGDEFVHFSYAGSAPHIAEACERLLEWAR